MTFEGYTRVTDALYPLSGLDRINPITGEARINPSVIKAAAERGERVHKVIDARISNIGTPKIDSEIKGYMDSFEKLPNYNYIEKPPRFFCDDHKITGECDAIYMDNDGQLVLVDFKTPARASKTWKLQGSAYSYLAKKVGGYNISRIEFIRLCKKGGNPEIITYEEDFGLYLKCLEIYRCFYERPEEIICTDYI